jgi:trans-2,3-dihydro-3-hydroxyanthranilate isomerase
MARRYTILDVFTATPLEGNPLAVVLDAEGLAGEAMQKIAAEFNLSETVFVLPAENERHTAKARIFTPGDELPFAGHPTIGTAILLAMERGGKPGDDSILLLEEGIGPIRCGVALHQHSGHCLFDAPLLPRPLEPVPTPEAAATALGLAREDIGFENHVPSSYDAGASFIFVPLANLDAIAKATPQTGAWREAFNDTPVYLYTRETEVVARQFHARMFAPALGIAEDPATGSAAAAFAAAAYRFDAHPLGTHTLIIEQGFEMGRPSLITVELDVEADGLAAVRIGGEAVITARGTLEF